MDIARWLEGLGLEQYEHAFREGDVDAEVLPELTADDLIALGVTSIGHRRKLLAAIAALRPATQLAAETTEPDRPRARDYHAGPADTIRDSYAATEYIRKTDPVAEKKGFEPLIARKMRRGSPLDLLLRERDRETLWGGRRGNGNFVAAS